MIRFVYLHAYYHLKTHRNWHICRPSIEYRSVYWCVIYLSTYLSTRVNLPIHLSRFVYMLANIYVCSVFLIWLCWKVYLDPIAMMRKGALSIHTASKVFLVFRISMFETLLEVQLCHWNVHLFSAISPFILLVFVGPAWWPGGLNRGHWLLAFSHHHMGSDRGWGMWDSCQWVGVRRWF